MNVTHTDPNWGKLYGGSEPSYHIRSGEKRGQPVWLYRKGTHCRWYDKDGEQIGPEQSNVAPALAYAEAHHWRIVPVPRHGFRF
jgi:hypothetical protein